MAMTRISFDVAAEDVLLLEDLIAREAGGDRNQWLRQQIRAGKERLRQEHITLRREGMEALHAEIDQRRNGLR